MVCRALPELFGTEVKSSRDRSKRGVRSIRGKLLRDKGRVAWRGGRKLPKQASEKGGFSDTLKL